MKLKRVNDYYNQKTLRLFDDMGEGIIILDESMRVEFANKAYFRYSGLQEKELIGRFIYDVRPGSISPQVWKTKKPIYNYFRNPCGTNESYTDVIPILDEEDIIGAFIIIRDKESLQKLFERIQEQNSHISRLTKAITDAYPTRFSFDNIIQSSHPYFDLAKRSSQNDSSVLLVGESGTGKEVLAQAIHAGSDRCSFPFIDINCAALPENLLESELFGYESGAFTGANKNGKIGLFELANGGTIFLDEVAEMPYSLQSKLLRVLQERQLRRIGGKRNIKLNVRVIAATNQNIELAVKGSRFRSDLYYRLAVVVISVPPLRERKNDFEKLFSYFLKAYEQKNRTGYRFSAQAMELLRSYEWPGNIRQLQNAIEYICMTASEGYVTPDSLPHYIFHQNHSSPPHQEGISFAYPNEKLSETLRRIEKEILSEMLVRFGNSTEAKKRIAAALGVSLSTLYTKLNHCGLLAESSKENS